MKVTKREQVLLGTLLILLLCYGFYKFIYMAQIQKITELKASRDGYSQKWELAKSKIASESERKDQYKVLNSKILNATGMLFPSIEQEKIIVILDKMLIDSNLQADVLGFSETSSGNNVADTTKTVTNESKNTTSALDKLVSDYNGTSKTNTSNASSSTSDSKIVGAYKTEVTLNFKGVYDELTSFIEQVEDYDKKIIINSITLTGAEGSEVSGTIILDFYSVPKLNNNDVLKWDYIKPIGSENPFFQSPTTSAINNTTTTTNAGGTMGTINNSTAATDNSKSDFVLYAKPKTADLHTVTIEKGKDASKLSYIYADNAGVELVDFYFTQVGTKYYYKYKTSKGTYPKDFSKPIEFVPIGNNIALDIFSQKRGLGSDLSGVNINITNDTDKKINVDILDDDKIKPRVKILKQIGNISVVRNYIQYVAK